jgi:hypothetical protein
VVTNGSTCTPSRLPPGVEAPPRATPGIGDLLRNLVEDLSALVRQELRLARTEIVDSVKRAARNTASIAIGAGVALFGALGLLAAGVAGLWVIFVKAGMSHAIAAWLAPLLVGGVLALIGYAMIRKGLRALRCTPIVPEKTTQTLKETGRWMHAKVT